MIKQAIIPLAGLGTRLLPLTSVIPKELLPINGRAGIEYILDECIEAGIKEFIFIISDKKKIIKQYFFNDKFFNKIIKKNKKMIKFVYQNKPKGTGDALLKCARLVKGNYFLFLLPDDLIIKKNCSREMIRLHKKYQSSIIASKKVLRKDVSRWGIFKIKKFKKNNFHIKDVVEKPSIKRAPSNYAVIGRYILPKKLFQILRKQKPGQGGEVHITDSIRQLIKDRYKFMGHIFSGRYIDCGTMNGYIKSSVEISKLKL